MSLPATSPEDTNEKTIEAKPPDSFSDDVHDAPAVSPEGEGEGNMPSPVGFILIIAGLCLAVFLVAIVSHKLRHVLPVPKLFPRDSMRERKGD